MPRYTILPIDPNFPATEVLASDAGAVLNLIGQRKCGEADVLDEGKYSFSLRLGPTGFWTLFQRDEEGAGQDAPRHWDKA